MFTPPKQLTSDFVATNAGCLPPTSHALRKGASFLAIALTRVPTRPEHMRQTPSGYHISHFAIIKTLSAGFAAAPYKNTDALTRADAQKMQAISKHNKNGKPITETIKTACSSGWPAAMRFYPYKRDGTYDKGERQDNLATEVCLSNTLTLYVNAETFTESTDATKSEYWKLPYDNDTPIEAYTLCEIEVMPKNSNEAQKGKTLRITRVRVHNMSMSAYTNTLAASAYPATYEESALVQILTRTKSPCIRSDISIDRASFFVRNVNPAAVVYNVQDNVTGLIHIVNWGTDDGPDADNKVQTYPEDMQSLVQSHRGSPMPIAAYIQQNAARYNKESGELDSNDLIDMHLDERRPAAMHIDIETKNARTLLNCGTTEQLTRLLQLAIHMGALRLFVVTDQYWASTRSGNSCFRAIPLIDESVLLAPLNRAISNAEHGIPIAERIAQPTGTLSDAISACKRPETEYALEIPTGDAKTPMVMLCATHTKPHECVSTLDRLIFSVATEYIVYDPRGKDLTLDFSLQTRTACEENTLLEARCSKANPEWLTNITYADHAYLITVTSQCDDATPQTYLNLLYVPGGGGARNTHNTVLDAAFDPSNAASVFTAIQNSGDEGALALVNPNGSTAGMRQLLQSLHSSHKAQRLTPTKVSPYLSIAHGVASPVDSPPHDVADTPENSPSPAKKRAKRA